VICPKGFVGISPTEPQEWEKEFRKIFTPSIQMKPYQGSYMLNIPYEEMVHWIDKTVKQEKEKSYQESKKDWKRIGESREKYALQELKDELVEEIEKLNIENNDTTAYGDGYKQATEDLSNLIKNK